MLNSPSDQYDMLVAEMARLDALIYDDDTELRSCPLNLAPQRPAPYKHSQILTYRRTGLTTSVFSVRSTQHAVCCHCRSTQ